MLRRLLPLALIPILVVWLAATSRPAADIPASVRVPGPESAQQRTGAPPTGAKPSGLIPDSGEVTVATSGAPKPSGGIGQPASYCKPSHCETPQPRIVDGITGSATYYCRPGISRCTVGYPFGMYAAAGPELRALLGPDWRGRTVVVLDANGRGVLVQLIDFCACGGDHVIDLYWTAYQGLVNPVTVSVGR